MYSLAELVAYSVAALALTALGLLVEVQSALRLAAGELSTGAWLAGFGLFLLYAGVYLLGVEEVRPRLLESAE